MKLLEERIAREGKILPGNVVKVDGFLNHRVDAAFLGKLADEFIAHFDINGLTAVMTVEARPAFRLQRFAPKRWVCR